MTTSPRRICPACESRDALAERGPIWPEGWACPSCGKSPERNGTVPRLAPDLDGTLSGFDPTSFAALASVEQGHFWFEERNALLAWLLQRFTRDRELARVLEIGCGTGFVLGMLRKVFPRAQVAGSELHSAGLERARERHGNSIELLQLDARRLLLEDALDIVCAFDVLEHIPEDEAVLDAVAKALMPAGLLVASVPQHPWLWSANDDIAYHVRRYKVGELESKVRRAGFEVLFSDSFTSVLLPAMALSRLGRRKAGELRAENEKVIETEFKLSPWLNSTFRAALQAEHGLRRLGMRFPLGGSRVIVARRRGS